MICIVYQRSKTKASREILCNKEGDCFVYHHAKRFLGVSLFGQEIHVKGWPPLLLAQYLDRLGGVMLERLLRSRDLAGSIPGQTQSRINAINGLGL